MAGFLQFSSFSNTLRIATQAWNQGVRPTDKWIAFLIGCYGAAGHHRLRFKKWILQQLRSRGTDGFLSLRMIRLPMQKAITVRLRTDNTSDYLVMGELLKESRLIPDRAPREIIDCGANIGVFSLWAGALFPTATIRCYEPDSANFSWLKTNLELNGFGAAKVFCQGVWSHETILYFHAAESYSGRVAPEPTGTSISCTLPVIGNGCWLKLDIEGAEYEVIPALLARGDRPDFISMEVHAARERGRSLVSILERYGYAVSGNLDPSFDCWEISAFPTLKSTQS